MRLLCALFVPLCLVAIGCLEIEDDPPRPVGSSLNGRVLVVGSQAAPEIHVADALRRARHAAHRLSQGEPVHAQDLVGAGEVASLHPAARATAPSLVRRQKSPQLRWRAGEVIVLFDARGRFDKPALHRVMGDMLKGAGFSHIAAEVSSCSMRLFCLVTLHDLTSKRLDEAMTEKVAKAMHGARVDGVKGVARNFYKSAFRIPNDPYYNYQWHYDFARLPAAWDISTGDPSLVVAVVDSGLKITHPDIVTRVAQGADLISDPGIAGDGNGRDPDPTDPGDNAFGNGQSSWHGTHVAGTIAAETDNAEGVAGILWQGRVQPVRVLGMGAQGVDFDILSGLAWAVGDEQVENVPRNTTPSKVVNLSLGGPTDSEGRQLWVDVIDVLTNQSAAEYGYPIVVVAAGNSNENVDNIVPANIPSVITVGATRVDGRRADYSNWGNSIDVMAPGGQTTVDQNLDGQPDGVLSLYDSAYNFEQGTSMATPHVTGIVALAVSIQPTLNQATAQELVRGAANPAGTCNEGCGTGHVDAAATLLAAGGVVSQEPRMAADVMRVVFQPGVAEQGFHVLNIGGAELAWTSEVVGPQAALFVLSPASGTVPPGSSMPVSLALSRGEFNAGSANLQLSGQEDAQGQEVRVDLEFNDELVPAQSNLLVVAVGAYRVLEGGRLKDAGSAFARRDDGFRWRIEGLEPGDYYVFAVGDDNNDGTFDPQRESFGAWPVASNASIIAVEDNTTYEGVDFGLSGGFVLGGAGGVGAPCVSNLDCTFAQDAECIADWPGGYCSRICDDGACGAQASCEVLDCAGGACNVCLSSCSSNNQCRTDEGFVCDPYGTCTPQGF